MPQTFPRGSAATGALQAALPGVIFASRYTPGHAFNATGKDDTAALNQAANDARAITTLGNSIGTLIFDAATYFLSGPVNLYNINVYGFPGGTRITAKSDWCSALPINSGFILDQQPSTPLGAPTQNNPSQAGSSSAYTLNQVVSVWVTAANSRNGGETPVSGMKQITVSGAGNSVTVNWSAIAGADSTTTYNVYVDRAGGTNSANAVKIASGQTGTSFTDATGSGGSGHPPTSDTTGGVGITPPDFTHISIAPSWQPHCEDIYINGPGNSASIGQVPAHLSGIRQAQGSVLRGIKTDGVFAGIWQNMDHEEVYNSLPSGYYGIYRSAPNGTQGDQVYESIVATGKWASIGLAAGADIGGAHMRKCHLAQSPFGIYKEAVGNFLGLVLADVTMDCVGFEACGNGVIFSQLQAAIQFCSMNGVSGDNTFGNGGGQRLSTATTDWQGTAIGRMNAPIDLNGGSFNGNNVLGEDPSTGIVGGFSGYVCGIAALVQQGGIWDATQLITQLRSDTKPFTNSNPPNADSLILYNSCHCRLFRASGAIAQGDLVMASAGGQPEVARSTGARKAVGVAVLAASDGQAVLVAQSGVIPVNSSANSIASGATLTADGTNNGAVTTGSLTPGAAGSTNIVGVAEQVSSGGLTRALLQGLA